MPGSCTKKRKVIFFMNINKQTVSRNLKKNKNGGGEPGTNLHVISWHVNVTAIITKVMMQLCHYKNTPVVNVSFSAAAYATQPKMF